MKILAILSILVLAACETLPTNPEWWMEREINACVPTAIAFKEGLNRYGVWSEVLRYSWIDAKTKKPRGHAVVVYLYPKGKNQLWSYDNLGSFRIRAFTNNVTSVAQQTHSVRGNPETIYAAEWIK